MRFIRRRLGSRVHFWFFDGWEVPAGRSGIVEVYPALWRRQFPTEGRTGEQLDAFCIAAWLSLVGSEGTASLLELSLPPAERAVAQIEGWVLGVDPLAANNRTKRLENRFNINAAVRA